MPLLKTLLISLLTLLNLIGLCQDSLTCLTPSQVKIANGTFEYAKGCREIKADLFSALDTATSIIETQKLQIEAQDSAKAKCDEKYQLLQDDEAALKKQVKKEKRKRTANAILFYVSVGVNVALATLILFR